VVLNNDVTYWTESLEPLTLTVIQENRGTRDQVIQLNTDSGVRATTQITVLNLLFSSLQDLLKSNLNVLVEKLDLIDGHIVKRLSDLDKDIQDIRTDIGDIKGSLENKVNLSTILDVSTVEIDGIPSEVSGIMKFTNPVSYGEQAPTDTGTVFTGEQIGNGSMSKLSHYPTVDVTTQTNVSFATQATSSSGTRRTVGVLHKLFQTPDCLKPHPDRE